MTCPRSPQVASLHDGQLPDAVAAELRRHVERCDECQAELAALRQLSMQLSQARHAEPTAAMMSRWVARSPRVANDLVVRRLAQQLTAAAAVVLVACMASLTILPSQNTSTQVIGDLESMMFSPLPMRSDEADSPSLAMARWMATDLDLGRPAGTGDQP